MTTPSVGEPGVGRTPPDRTRPLAGYALLTGFFSVVAVTSVIWLRRSRKGLPDRYPPSDLLLAGAATYKLSRLLAKDKVTSFVRAPFTEHRDQGGSGEVEEEPRGYGVRRAIGELLTCPYCLGVWVASGWGIALVAAPRASRLACFTLTALGISDFLQVAYKAAEEGRLLSRRSAPSSVPSNARHR
jgi:hypothetical protein